MAGHADKKIGRKVLAGRKIEESMLRNLASTKEKWESSQGFLPIDADGSVVETKVQPGELCGFFTRICCISEFHISLEIAGDKVQLGCRCRGTGPWKKPAKTCEKRVLLLIPILNL